MDRVKPTLLEMTALPDGLARLRPDEVRAAFPEPAIIRLKGRQEPPVFLSVLLHGNETTGWRVLQRLQTWIESHGLPRSLIIFVGNVRATEAGMRHLSGQPDFNRIWAGGDTSEHHLAQDVLRIARAAKPFCAIDIHNNTGRNPLYACINRIETAYIHLASLFSPTIVHFDNPPTVISMAMSKICPAVTVEAGRADEPHGIEAAFNLVVDALHLSAFRDHGVERPVTVYHTIGRVELAPGTGFAFADDSEHALAFPPGMEGWNFCSQPAGTRWARLAEPGSLPLRVFNEARRDITDVFFRSHDGHVEQVREVTPSMLTRDEAVIRSDCLGYLMEPITP